MKHDAAELGYLNLISEESGNEISEKDGHFLQIILNGTCK